MLTTRLLRQVFPLCADPEGWTQALNPALERYEINTRARLSSFLAQTGHESSQFNRLVESLNYTTPQRLMRVWPRRFPSAASALPYVRNEAKLANFVYANRLGNGNSASGDGFRFRGRGIIQITGRSNYAGAGQAIHIDLVNAPDRLLTKEVAALAAADPQALSDAVPVAVRRASQALKGGPTALDASASSGVVNTLVLLQSALPGTLQVNRPAIEELLDAAEPLGDYTAKHVGKVRELLELAAVRKPVAYLQIANEAQRPIAEALAVKLRAFGYEAPDIELVGERAP